MFMAVMEDLRVLRSELMATLARVERMIERLSPPTPAVSADVTALPRTRAIEWILDQEGTVMRPIEIWSALQHVGRSDPKMEIQVTTYDLWERGRIERVGRGLYRSHRD
jgi:hypothetical protein